MIYLDENQRENELRQIKNNKQFNVYKKEDFTFAENLINQLEGGKHGQITTNN